MLSLESITLTEVGLPLKEPFRISSGVVAQRRILLLEVRETGGAVGWGECVAGEEPYFSPETIDTAWYAIETWLAPLVLGAAFEHPREVFPRLEAEVRGHPMAKAAIEMAIWELAATLAGRPLADYLCAGRAEPRPEVEVGISLGIQDSPERLVEKARRSYDEGYRKIKIKIAPGADVDFVAAVRAALGPEAPLMADANSAYSLADAKHLRRLDELDLMMIEQPLDRTDLLRHAALQRRMTTPICLDESITGPDRAEDMIALGAGRIVNIKPGRVGGFAQSLAIHDLCLAAGIPVWCGGMLESGVGRAHNVALASLPGFTKPGDLSPSRRYWERDLVDPEWTMDGGLVRVPRERPGMGVDVDRERVAALAVRRGELVKQSS